jgi:hypothetical protein
MNTQSVNGKTFHISSLREQLLFSKKDFLQNYTIMSALSYVIKLATNEGSINGMHIIWMIDFI